MKKQKSSGTASPKSDAIRRMREEAAEAAKGSPKPAAESGVRRKKRAPKKSGG